MLPCIDAAMHWIAGKAGMQPPRDRGRSCSGIAAVCLVIFGLVCLVPFAFGENTSDLETQVREIALQLRCPVCQGLSVGDSPSELANEMRTLVRAQLQQGKSTPEVLDY